jgi:hypothetical protein
LPNSNKFFKFRSKAGYNYDILNAKGKKITINGNDRFKDIVEEKGSDNYIFVSLQDPSKSSIYTTLTEYQAYSTFRESYYTEAGLIKIKNDDRARYNRSREPAERTSANSTGSGANTVTIGFSTYKFNFYPVSIITTDKNLHVIKTETGYVYDTK